MKKALKILWKIINAIGILFLIGFVLVVCLQRFSDNKISIFNYRMFTVISGSMEPTYSIGDVLISKSVDASSIKVGDVVTYLGEKNSLAGKVVTHQVVEIQQDSDGSYLFYTKGTANKSWDPVVKEDQIYGVVIYKTVALSTIYKIISTKLGFYLCIIVPILFIVGTEIVYTLLKKDKRLQNK